MRRVGSLTLLVEMKGHVGGGPVCDSLWVSYGRSNLCRSKCPHTQTHQFVYLCRNGSRRCRPGFGYSTEAKSYINLRV